MGWLFSIICFIAFCTTGREIFLIVSGIYAIAGAIGFKTIITVKIKEEKKNEETVC